MVINDPTAFKVRKRVRRRGRQLTEWVQMRKGVADLDVSLTANRRYLDALAAVEDPTPAIRDLDKLTKRNRGRDGKSVRAFNPLAREDRQLFEAVTSGAHHIRGITNRQLREELIECKVLKSAGQTTQQLSAKVSRLLRRLHLHGLIAKVPHTRRWRGRHSLCH